MAHETFLTVDAALIDDGLMPLDPPSSPIELANLLGDIGYRNSKKQRWAKQAYCLRFHANPRTVQRQLQWLESVGAVTTDAVKRQALPLPWSAHEEGTASARSAHEERTVSPLSYSYSQSHSQSKNKSKAANGLTPEQQQLVIETYCQLSPDHWVKAKVLSAAMKPVLAGYVKRAGGFDAFMLELRWQLKRIGTSPMAKRGKSKCTIVTLLGSSKTTDKDRWTQWSAEHGDLGSDPDSLDTLKPEHPDFYPPHNQNALDSGLIALKENHRQPPAPKEEGLKFYANWFN